MKKILALLVSVVLFAGLFAGCAKPNQPGGGATTDNRKQTDKKIGLATDEGGRGDKSFNDAAIAGLDKISKEYTVTPQILESKAADQYEPNLKALTQSNDLVFGVGFKMHDAMDAVAKANPNKKYAIIDSVVEQPNVMSINFKEEEGSFLMGVIAGKMTKTNKIGFIGGVDMELIQKFEAGFIAGVKAVNPAAAEDLINRKNVRYAGNFSDVNKGYELAKQLYNSGVDVIYHAAGGVGIGLFNAAKELKNGGKTVWAIGVDSDQALTVPDKADIILASMMKRVDVATYTASKDLIENNFQGGKVVVLGLKEDGVGISNTINPAVTKDVLDLADKYKKAIVDGTIKVPTKPGDVKAFQAPEIK